MSLVVFVFSTAQWAGAQTAVDDPPKLSLEQLLEIEVQSVFGASKFLQKRIEAPAAVMTARPRG